MILHFHKRSEKKYAIILPFSIMHIIPSSCVLLYSCRLELLLGITSFHPEKFVFLVREICSQNISGLVHLGMSLFTLQFWRRIFPHREDLDNIFFFTKIKNLKKCNWVKLYIFQKFRLSEFSSIACSQRITGNPF